MEHDENDQMGFTFIGLSILAHVFFLLAMLFLQNLHFTKPLPPVIQVDLISFAPEPVFEDLSGPDEPAKAVEEMIEEKVVDPNKDLSKEVVTPEDVPKKAPPKKMVVKKPDISLKTKPKNLKELIKSKQEEAKKADKKKPEKVVENKETPKQAAEDTSNQLTQALSRLEQMVKEQNKQKQARAKDKEGGGTVSGSGKKNYKPIDLYNMVLASAINQNWAFNERLANMEKTLEVRILITVLKSGQLRDIFFETRSGNNYLDESAEKAIRKALPLPELPKGYSTYTVGLIFTPKGLK